MISTLFENFPDTNIQPALISISFSSEEEDTSRCRTSEQSFMRLRPGKRKLQILFRNKDMAELCFQWVPF
jgi:hypothetical protein